MCLLAVADAPCTGKAIDNIFLKEEKIDILNLVCRFSPSSEIALES